MKHGAPNLLSSAAPSVVPPPVEREQLVVELDLSKVPRNLRRRALMAMGEPKAARLAKRPSNRKAHVNAKEELMAMDIAGHEWSLGRGGREIAKRRTGNNLRVVAKLRCACDHSESVASRGVLPPEVLDKKFRQKGWKLDPATCPDCIQQPKEERQMASEGATVSAQAGLAQAKVFKLLVAQFDEEAGRYRNGYTDDRVAKETGCALVFVQQCRKECFGELKEDPAIAELRNDIGALEGMIAETTAQLQQELAQLKAKLARVSK